MSKSPNTYGDILRSSSIVGGAQVLIYVIGLVRVKLAAVLLGPAGVGLLGIYQSVMALVGMAAGLGIESSGVREVARADSTGDSATVASTVKTLRRASWGSGLLGLVLMVGLAWPLSRWVLDAGQLEGSVALLGWSLLFTAVDSGEAAILRGTRRIADLARRNVAASLAGATVSVSLYVWLGADGIVPGLIAASALSFGASRWYARRVELPPATTVSWRETWRRSKGLMGLGLAFMWTGLLGAAVTLVIRTLIMRELGVDANGIYQAAWGISGLFAGFILGAMGQDFYPRLSGVASEDGSVNDLVNQQTEIGVLLSVPGLLGSLALAPWAMQLLYSSDFVSGTDLLAWLVLGTFGRVVSWPMGFVLLAKGASRIYAITETVFGGLHVLLVSALLPGWHLAGVGVAYLSLYVAYSAAMLLILRQLTRFSWTPGCVRLLGGSALLAASAFAVRAVASDEVAGVVVGGLALISAGMSVRGIAKRLGAQHRYVRFVAHVPIVRRLVD